MIENDILAHARQCAPAESCGYVVSTPHGERYIPCQNTAADPLSAFRISPEDYLQVQTLGEVVALVHSHPGGSRYLSSADRQCQIASGVPWYLVCDEQVYRYRCVPPLLGRHYDYGVQDCYTLLRDAYHLAGIELPRFSYDATWWATGANLYLDNLARHGFYPVARQAAQAGDWVLCCFGSSVANHAALLCDDGQILHQVQGQLSLREVYGDKWQRRTHSVWRHQAWCAGACMGIYNDLAAVSIYG